MNATAPRDRLRTLALLAAIIASGLLLRRFGPSLGLPFIVVKYGGSLLWGAMVHVALTFVAHRRPSTHLAILAGLIRRRRRILPPLSYALAGRLPADHAGSAAARQSFLALEPGRIRAWHSAWQSGRPGREKTIDCRLARRERNGQMPKRPRHSTRRNVCLRAESQGQLV